jgi:hypothetical protein
MSEKLNRENHLVCGEPRFFLPCEVGGYLAFLMAHHRLQLKQLKWEIVDKTRRWLIILPISNGSLKISKS